MLRQGLRSVVDSHAPLHVVGEASNGLEAIEAVRMLRPDVVVMDINMPQMNGIESTTRIKEEFQIRPSSDCLCIRHRRLPRR